MDIQLIIVIILSIFSVNSCYKLHVYLHHKERYVVEDIYDSDKEQESWQFAQQQAVLDQPKDERTIVDRDGEGLVRTKRDESNHKVSQDMGPYVTQIKMAEQDFLQRYDIFVVIVTCSLASLFGLFCSYWCCCKGGSCGFLKRGGTAAGKRAAENYMAGLRKDSQGNFYYDELTEEEKEAMGVVKDELEGFV